MHEELENLVRTFEALGPLVGNAVKSGQLLKPQCERWTPLCGVPFHQIAHACALHL